MKNALLGAAHQLRLSGLHCGHCGFLVAGADCFFNLAEVLRTRLVRFLLMVSRRAETRVAFFADFVLAIELS